MKLIITHNIHLNYKNIHNGIVFINLNNRFKFYFIKNYKIHNNISYAEIQKLNNKLLMKYYYVHGQYIGYHGNITPKLFKKLKYNIIRYNKLKVFL